MSPAPSQREVKEESDTRKDGEKQVDGARLAVMAAPEEEKYLPQEKYSLSGMQLCLFVYPSILTSSFFSYAIFSSHNQSSWMWTFFVLSILTLFFPLFGV